MYCPLITVNEMYQKFKPGTFGVTTFFRRRQLAAIPFRPRNSVNRRNTAAYPFLCD